METSTQMEELIKLLIQAGYEVYHIDRDRTWQVKKDDFLTTLQEPRNMWFER
jgi:hypothetical protein